MRYPTISNLDCKGKRIAIREDFNVPLEHEHITDDTRIRAALPSIRYLLQQGAAVILLSHLGRPEEGYVTTEYSLAPVAKRLQTLLNHPVRFITDWIDGVHITPGEVILCENVRFQIGEKSNKPSLAKKIAGLGDIFVMDAFATAHRNEASTAGAMRFAQQSCLGLLFEVELNALTRVLENPERPVLAIVGGSKISGKLQTLEALLTKVNVLLLGGGIANTFLLAQGYPIGQSLVEVNLLSEASRLMELAQNHSLNIVLPRDVIVAKEVSATAKTCRKELMAVEDDDKILDIGEESITFYKQLIISAKTILWNGPVGVFELAPFEQGTRALSLAIADSKAFSVAGGGDTLAAIGKYAVRDKISYISTGGGAFLSFIEGKTFPVLEILKERTITRCGSEHDA